MKFGMAHSRQRMIAITTATKTAKAAKFDWQREWQRQLPKVDNKNKHQTQREHASKSFWS